MRRSLTVEEHEALSALVTTAARRDQVWAPLADLIERCDWIICASSQVPGTHRPPKKRRKLSEAGGEPQLRNAHYNPHPPQPIEPMCCAYHWSNTTTRTTTKKGTRR